LEEVKVRTLTIEATSLASARGFYEALASLGAELVDDVNGTYEVRIPLDGKDSTIVTVLQLLEEHVATRGGSSARIGLDGRSYLLEARSQTSA
jgi:hypothetical protein